MRLLIDGYNLLYATDLFGTGTKAGTFAGSREALLEFLSQRLGDSLRRRTCIVFDASQAPPGLPATLQVADMDVRFARGYADADALLEQIIEDCPAPREVLVVSSDHRVQRAARRRGMRYVDSAVWFRDQAQRRPLQRPSAASSRPEHLPVSDTPEHWIAVFSQGIEAETPVTDRPADTAPPTRPTPDASDEIDPRDSLANPFPPGYCDDLFSDQ